MARTLLRDSPVLILDEPTTGLDSATAGRVLPRLLAGRTVVLITHDPEIAALAHRTLYIESGRIGGGHRIGGPINGGQVNGSRVIRSGNADAAAGLRAGA